MPSLIRKISPSDNSSMAAIIRIVMPAFGASGEGFAIHDAEVDDLYSAYAQPRTAYFVCEEQAKILGGAGIAPLQGGAENFCELKKMYFLPEARGKGLGQLVLTACLREARNEGFDFCYIETFNTMKAAIKLYQKNGFKQIDGPMGNTGHFACDLFYLRQLD